MSRPSSLAATLPRAAFSAPDVESDRLLVEAVLDGNPAAFDILVERYHGILYRAALGMVGDSDEAKDLVQVTFVRAYRKLASYKPRYKFFSWIYRILVNQTLNALAARKPTEPLEAGVDVPCPSDPPDREYERAALRQRIRTAMDRLTPEYREVIVLRHFLELSYREMSGLLDIPEKTVKSRLFTARRRLADMLLTADAARA